MHPQIPVVNSVESLSEIVRADLLERNLIPDGDAVVYAHGEPGKRTNSTQSKLPRVWFWLENQFTIDVSQTGDPASVALTAVVEDGDEDQFVDAGASIGVEKIRARVVMYARVPEEGTATPPRRSRITAVNAERAGAQLRHRVYGAIFRACNGSFRVLAAKNIAPMGSEFVNGSASEMVVELYYHIADDAYPTNQVGTEGVQTNPDGEEHAEVDTP